MEIGELKNLVTSQLSQIKNEERRNCISAILVEPFTEPREWDYSENTKHLCWVIAKPDEHSYFAYCEGGFGPSAPWGIISIDSSGSIGPDSCWYQFLEDLYIDAGPWGGEPPPAFEVR